jgi:hypothetical protein
VIVSSWAVHSTRDEDEARANAPARSPG